MAIKGLATQNSHFIISDLEHNAVLRPLEKLKLSGVSKYSVANVFNDDYKTLKSFEEKINKNTVAIICTGASNVFGVIPPIRLLGKLAHKYNLLFVMDCAQLGGILPIDMQHDEIDIICCAGHKGLMGPTGIGLMIVNDKVKLDTIIEGGTGSNSASAIQPDISPDKFESGTPNVLGIIGLSSSIDFINEIGVNNIYKHELKLLTYLQKNLDGDRNILLYTDFFNKLINFITIIIDYSLKLFRKLHFIYI